LQSAGGWIGAFLPDVENNAATFLCPDDETGGNSGGGGDLTAANVSIEGELPASLEVGQVQDPVTWFLYTEASGVALSQGVPVANSEPGDINGAQSATPSTIPSGTEVDIHLLHYDPPTRERAYDISVSFSGPILGLIQVTSDLVPTDDLSGQPHAYATQSWRGLENDEFMTLSEDMQTLTIHRCVCDGDKTDQVRIITEPGGVAASSFAINSRAPRLNRSANKVLLLDYGKIVAKVAGEEALTLGEWGDYVAPRHSGTLNVCFADGHVEARTPSEIDPRSVEFNNRFWKPYRDPVWSP
jgi:prepilin-type processing-associated H-X9-DG protein